MSEEHGIMADRIYTVLSVFTMIDSEGTSHDMVMLRDTYRKEYNELTMF